MKINPRMNACPAISPRFSTVLSIGLIVLAILASIGSSVAQAQCTVMGPPPTNAGTEFLLCFERNSNIDRISTDLEYCEIDIASLDAQQTTVTITSRRYPTLQQTFVLGPRDTVTWRISDTWPDLWINSADSIDDRVVKVTATSPIICYGQNRKAATADGFLALPASSCGTEYRIMSYGNSAFNLFPDMMPSQFAVAAFQPNTNVTITPSSPTATGHAAGAPFTVTLDAGQCIQVQTDGDTIGQDLTGSIVSSTAPVAVFGSNGRTEIPTNFINSNGSTSRDMLLEQLPPIGVWGKNFVLAPLQIDATSKIRAEGDLMRVLALKDNTVITVNGNPWVTLNANGYADSIFHTPLVVSAANNPILLGEYAHSSSTGATDNGDPFLAIVPPLDESYNDYTFFASNDPIYAVQKVIIATDTSAMSHIQFDNVTLPSSFFNVIPLSVAGQSYAIAELNVTAGAHRVYTNQSTNAFTILSYGLGLVISYGYTAGALLKPLRSLFVHPQPLSAPRQTNRVDFHNILNEQVYLDEADFIPDNPADTRFGIHIAETLDPITGFMEIGQTSSLHLTTDPFANDRSLKPISGTVKIYSHTYNWHDLEPAEERWTYYPSSPTGGASGGTAGVASGDLKGSIGLHTYPNPFGLTTTISFSMPESADISLTLVDELGRVVRHIASGEFAAGPYNIRLDRHQLPNGFYNCELRSDKLGIVENIAIVATE